MHGTTIKIAFVRFSNAGEYNVKLCIPATRNCHA